MPDRESSALFSAGRLLRHGELTQIHLAFVDAGFVAFEKSQDHRLPEVDLSGLGGPTPQMQVAGQSPETE